MYEQSSGRAQAISDRERLVLPPYHTRRGFMAYLTPRRPSVRNRLLAALSLDDWAHLAPHLEAVELPFDQTIHATGGPVDAVFFVETGMVSVIVTLEDGDQVEAGLIGPEGLVGLLLIYGDSHALAELRVQMEGTALRIGAAAFRAEMERSATLRGLLLRYALAFNAQVTM